MMSFYDVFEPAETEVGDARIMALSIFWINLSAAISFFIFGLLTSARAHVEAH